jgi:hypothetical protein
MESRSTIPVTREDLRRENEAAKRRLREKELKILWNQAARREGRRHEK